MLKDRCTTLYASKLQKTTKDIDKANNSDIDTDHNTSI